VLSFQRVFQLEENQTTMSRERLAGPTTFMAVAYVAVLNPNGRDFRYQRSVAGPSAAAVS
jgi:hypothetical protein